jgi:hypothetical protein
MNKLISEISEAAIVDNDLVTQSGRDLIYRIPLLKLLIIMLKRTIMQI